MMVTAAMDVNMRYDSASLLSLRPPLDSPPPAEFIDVVRRLRELQASHNEKEYPENAATERHRKRRRGRRSGVRVRMRRRGMKTPLPAITFGNIRSIRNKMDELCTNCKFIQEYRDSAVIALTETWLQDRDADSTVTIDGFLLVRSDRRGVDKNRGGGVAAYVNERWCTQVSVKGSYCDNNIEYLALTCRPFYLPREFNKINLVLVYIPPDADESIAADILENCVTNCENESPNSAIIVLGDFNHCDFQRKVPTYEQTVNCPTRGNATLDKMYCNIKDGYKVFKRPNVGNGDHNMLYCVPTYKQLLKRVKPKEIEIRKWDDNTRQRLQACFECTDWSVLIENGADVNINLDIFNGYFNFCYNMIVPTKKIKIYPNNKPWIKKELKSMLNEKHRLVRNESDVERRTLQRNIDKKITESKRIYKEKVEGLFKTNKTKDAWKGLKTLCGHKKKQRVPEPENINTYVNEMNAFFARFDKHDFNDACNEIMTEIQSHNDERIIIRQEDVQKSLQNIRAGKASGPDGMPARALKYCAKQLTHVLTTLFQDSLDQGVVPYKWKESEVKPIGKTNYPKDLRDYRPVVLTSNIMKCLESILKNLICEKTNKIKDPMQFAYCKNRSVQDATLILLNDISKHLDKPKSQVRALYIDFSSAFNTMQPHILLRKMLDMGVNRNILKWMFSFLTQRPQYTNVNNVKSNVIITNTGAPQGCVLSPVLFTLYTDDCRSESDCCNIVKYADDTVILGKIVNDNYEDYLSQVKTFVDWSKQNFLELNVKKTKEMIFDFRAKNKHVPELLTIEEENVERVNQYKYLGFMIDDQLKGSANTDMVSRKCNQRLHFVRILRNLQVDKTFISLFYKSILESVLYFSITAWYGRLTCKDKNKVGKIVKKAGKLGAETTSLDKLYQTCTIKQVNRIMKDATHPLHNCYRYLKSGRRLALPMQRTDRYRKSFVPRSILLFNHLSSL